MSAFNRCWRIGRFEGRERGQRATAATLTEGEEKKKKGRRRRRRMRRIG